MIKKTRHELIIELVEKNNICTQDELMEMLLKKGIEVTQATISRDIKELRLIKQPADNGQYKYYAPVKTDEKYTKYYAIFSESVTSVDYAQNICVIKCHAGTANAACAAIDAINMSDILGTIAGDDTIFVLCKSERTAQNTKLELESLI